MKKLFGALLVLLCLGLVSVAHATTTVSTTFETPVNVQTSISTSGCSNSPGPTITLKGALSLGGVVVKLLFENNVIGTHKQIIESHLLKFHKPIPPEYTIIHRHLSLHPYWPNNIVC